GLAARCEAVTERLHGAAAQVISQAVAEAVHEAVRGVLPDARDCPETIAPLPGTHPPASSLGERLVRQPWANDPKTWFACADAAEALAAAEPPESTREGGWLRALAAGWQGGTCACGSGVGTGYRLP